MVDIVYLIRSLDIKNKTKQEEKTTAAMTIYILNSLLDSKILWEFQKYILRWGFIRDYYLIKDRVSAWTSHDYDFIPIKFI